MSSPESASLILVRLGPKREGSVSLRSNLQYFTKVKSPKGQECLESLWNPPAESLNQGSGLWGDCFRRGTLVWAHAP